jgi:hypothetical protein
MLEDAKRFGQGSENVRSSSADSLRLSESKQFIKVHDMLLPYNSFFGISNDLKCLANKQDNLPLEALLYQVMTQI